MRNFLYSPKTIPRKKMGVALHLTVVEPKSRFFSSSQVRDLANLGRKRQSRTGFERTTIRCRPTTMGYTGLFLILLLLSCGLGGPPATPDGPTWTIAELLTQRQSQESVKQTTDVKNCAEPEPQLVTCSAGTSDNFTYDLAATDLQRAAIATNIANTLGLLQPKHQSLNLSDPPSGFIYRYQIAKRYQVMRGEALARSTTGEEAQIQYTFLASCEIITQSREEIACDTAQDSLPTPLASALPPALTPTQPQPQSPTPISTITAAPATPTPVIIGQNCAAQPAAVFVNFWQTHQTLIGCPTSDLVVIPTMAEESFQGGHLFWRADTDELYIIYDRLKSGPELTEGQWEPNPNWRKWDGSDSEGIGLNPPPGLAEPKRGFGWLWRTHLGREEGPLGWALDREYGFANTGQVQRFEKGLMFKGSQPKIYVLAENGRFLAQ